MPLSRRSFAATGLAAAGLLTTSGTAAAAAPEALTRQGRVRGFTRNGATLFLGLPYGADTSGPRRFLPPAPPASWRGVRDATRFGQRAPQPGGPPVGGDFGAYFTGGRAEELAGMPTSMGEDCLVLNVVTPAADQGRRPVLFYIHGGGFTSGSGQVMSLGDRFVVREDVVLVTVNHRLSALGFLYLGGLSPRFAQGNPGMLDLVAALRWVRDNIAGFGGDPAKVTIFGESGGASKIALLMAMPQAQGLFRAAIVQSGLMPRPQPADEATAAARTFMASVGLAADELDKLQALPFERFVPSPGLGRGPGSWPAADGETLRADVWSQAPSSAARVPLIIGYCKDELSLFSLTDPSTFKLAWADVPARLSKAVGGGLPPGGFEPVVAAYRQVFPADTPTQAYFRISSDASFGRAMVAMADLKAAQTPPVYFYRVEFDTRLPPGLGAIHTAELPMTVDLNWRAESAGLSRQISGAWAAFARTGDPNHAGLPAWRPYDQKGHECMIFDVSCRSGPDPQAAPRNRLHAALAAAGVPHWNPL